MDLKKFISTRLINKINYYGWYELSTLKALKRAKNRNVKANTVIDVGASDGRWSEKTMKVFPNAQYYLIEANKAHEKSLIKFKNKHNNVDYIIAAGGDADGTIYFDTQGQLWGGIARHEKQENDIEVPVVKIDSCATKNALEGPFLIKLDTHGFEVPIFEGAAETLKKTSLIVVETYNFQIQPDSLKFYEMCKYMEEKGFGCVDISEPMHREKDKALWQFDLFFAPLSSEEFKYNTYN